MNFPSLSPKKYVTFNRLVLVAVFALAGCGGGGGGGGVSVVTPEKEVLLKMEIMRSIAEKGEERAEEIATVANEVSANKDVRRGTIGGAEGVGSITKSNNPDARVGVQKANEEVVLRSAAGLLSLFQEPVVEKTGGGKTWEGTKLAQPEDVNLDYNYVICHDDGSCGGVLNNIDDDRHISGYYVSGFWHYSDASTEEFGVFVDGSPHTAALPTNAVAEFLGLSSGYYWQGEENTPAGSYLGIASFTANFDGTPTVSGELNIVRGFDSQMGVDPFDGSIINLFLAATPVLLTSNIYATSGGAVSCGSGCTLRDDDSVSSWGGMFINVDGSTEASPGLFAGTYGVSDVQISGRDYDFLGIFSSYKLDAFGDLDDSEDSTDVFIDSAPNPDPSPSEVVVAQFGQADNLGGAQLISDLTIGLSQDAQNGLNFFIDNGPEDSLLHDIVPEASDVWGEVAYVSFGETIHWSEREKVDDNDNDNDDDDQYSYYDIYTDREGNRDSEYWVGGLWYEFPGGDNVTLDDYELGALAYYKGLPLRNLRSSGTATFHGQASGVALDTTRSPRQDYYNYADWKVRLTANFGSASTSINGELYDIISIAGDRPLPSNITLGVASANEQGLFSGQTSAVGYASGNWGGQLYGDGASHTAGTFSIDKSDNSQALAGWFQAESGVAELSISDNEKSVVQFGRFSDISGAQVSLSYIDYRADYINVYRTSFMINSDGALVDAEGSPASDEAAGYSRDSDGYLIDSGGNALIVDAAGRIYLLNADGSFVRRPKYHVSTGPVGSSLQNIGATSGSDGGIVTINGEDNLWNGRYKDLPGGGTLDAYFYTDRTYQESRNRDTDYLEGGLWVSNADDSANAELGAFAAYSGLLLINLPNSGTASYSGSATGVALNDTANNDGDFDDYASWRVTLQANFSDNSISGQLLDISRTEGDRPMPSNITLGAAPISGERFFRGATSATGYDNGNWGGRFYGDEASHTAGTFGLQKTDGTQSIVGFFHAEKE